MTEDHVPLTVDELMLERAAHRETAATLERERTAHAETKLAVLAMMAAVDVHFAQLRELVETCTGPQ